MRNLAQHIELLLRDNDCVILPGFGGFIAHDVPAYYVKEEGLYYPPSRSISFNAAITMNDGLLVQSYMKSYQVDYARATYMVDVAIERLTDTLYEKGCAILPHIGTLTQDIHQSLRFTPDVVGIESPALFGLGAFHIIELSRLSQHAEALKKTDNAGNQKNSTVNLHADKSVLYHILSTAAVFLLLIMVALPTGTHRSTDMASLINMAQIEASFSSSQEKTDLSETATQLFTEHKGNASDTLKHDIFVSQQLQDVDGEESSSVSMPDYVPEAEGSPSNIESGNIIAVAESSERSHMGEYSLHDAETSQPTKTYHIIVASLPNHRGADDTLSQFTNMGYSGASLVERDNRVRISLMQFADKNEANKQLKLLRQNDKFQNAWLLAVHN